ncbi:MAG: hypothetical protein M0D55_07870 [Elusimicrobiota bacterium]|nr:MAG: hypothetical protein M0D55_07870 [Elusimicrobiota bacterium]
MTRLALLTALLLVSAPALRAGDEGKGDHNEDGHPDNGHGRGFRGGGRRWWWSRARSEPAPQTVVVTVPEGRLRTAATRGAV